MCWWVISLSVVFAVLDVSLAVSLCINCSFFYILYTIVCLKKVYSLMFDNNFGKCEPIFKFFFTNCFLRKFSMYTPQRYETIKEVPARRQVLPRSD